MEKHREKILKIFNYLIILLSVLSALMGFSIGFIPNMYLGTSGVLIFFGIPIVIELLNILIQSNFIKDEKQREIIRKQNLYVILFIYTIALINLLFVGSIFRTYSWVYSEISYAEFIKYSVNIIPFYTIYTYISRLMDNTINLNIVLMNILGNLILLMPLSYLIPRIFNKRINTVKKFTVFIFFIALSIEILQLIFMTGQVDIDDVILNSIGAIILYCVLNMKIVNKFLSKIKLI